MPDDEDEDEAHETDEGSEDSGLDDELTAEADADMGQQAAELIDGRELASDAQEVKTMRGKAIRYMRTVYGIEIDESERKMAMGMFPKVNLLDDMSLRRWY